MVEAATAARKLSHSMTWVKQTQMTIQDARELGIYKGVLIREGTSKDGRDVDMEHIMQGAGSLHAMTLQGNAPMGIDHLKEIPVTYTQKYGYEISDPYPVGIVLDAAAVKADDGKWEIQAYMHVINPTVRRLIDEHKIIGNSVEGLARDVECDSITCKEKGTVYTANTLILETVPNGDGTWIAPVDESDIGTLLKPMDTMTVHSMSGTKQILHEKLEKLHKDRAAAGITQDSGGLPNATHPSNIEPYYNTENSTWRDGEKSVSSFLEKEKGMTTMEPKTMANISRFIMEHPLNENQLKFMRSSDIMAWWGHTRADIAEAKIVEMEQQQQEAAAEQKPDGEKPKEGEGDEKPKEGDGGEGEEKPKDDAGSAEGEGDGGSPQKPDESDPKKDGECDCQKQNDKGRPLTPAPAATSENAMSKYANEMTDLLFAHGILLARDSAIVIRRGEIGQSDIRLKNQLQEQMRQIRHKIVILRNRIISEQQASK